MKRFLFAALFSTLSFLHGQPLLTPPDGTLIKGDPYRMQTIPAGKKGTLRTHCRISLPEFEKANLNMEFFVPPKCRVTGVSLELTTLPGMLPAYNFGKTYITPVADVDASKPGKQTLAIPLDIRTLQKTGSVPFPCSIRFMRLHYEAGAEESFYCGKISLQPSGLYCRFSTGNGKLFVCDLSEKEQAPAFTIFNQGGACRGLFEFKVRDIAGKIVDSGTVSRDFSAGETVRVPLKKPTKAGVYFVTYKLEKKGPEGFSHSREIRYAAMYPTRQYDKLFTNEFLFSVCAHLPHYPMEEMTVMADYMALAGLNHVRSSGTYWMKNNPRPGVWDLKQAERILKLLTDRNLEYQNVLMVPPDWAVSEEWKRAGKWGVQLPKLDLYENYVTEYVARFKGRIRMFEDINEPNLTKFWNPERYARYEKSAYRALKAGNPEALLLSGSWGGVTGSWAESYYAQNPGIADILAFHYHGPFETGIAEVEQIRRIMKKYKLKQKWFANECAYSTTNDNSAAQALFKKLIYSWSQGSIGYTWYNLRNKGWNPKNGELTYGLLTEDLCPRASYVTYNMLAGVFRDAKFVRSLKIKPDVFAFRFEKGDHAMIPMWTMSCDYGIQTVICRTTAESVNEIDLYGNIREIPVKDGIIPVSVSNDPSTLRLSPANAELDVVSPLFTTGQKVIATAGSKLKYRFEIQNPFPEKKMFNISMLLPKGLSTDVAAQKITIPGKGKGYFDTLITCAKDFTATTNVYKKIVLISQNPDLSGRMEFLIQPTFQIRQAPNGSAKFFCNKREQYTSFTEGKPGADHLYWTGISDLSAMVCVFYPTADELHIRVCVDDDIHNQPFQGINMYQGDSLQLMFLFPNQKGQWEIGASRRNDGTSESYIWMAPPEFDKTAIAKKIRIVSYRNQKVPQKTLWYEIKIPLKSVGTSLTELKKYGFRFNVMINDNDGPCREGYISIISGAPKKADNFPVISLGQ